MISLNVDGDLDKMLRSLATQTNRSLSAVCCGLLRLGLKHKPAEVLTAINAAARPLGRPLAPQQEDSPKGKPGAKQGWELK